MYFIWLADTIALKFKEPVPVLYPLPKYNGKLRYIAYLNKTKKN